MVWPTEEEKVLFDRNYLLYFNNVEPDAERATKHAWSMCRVKFPRLKKHCGFKQKESNEQENTAQV